MKSRTSCCESGYRCTCSSPACRFPSWCFGRSTSSASLPDVQLLRKLPHILPHGADIPADIGAHVRRRNNSGSRSVRSARGCVSGRGASGRGGGQRTRGQQTRGQRTRGQRTRGQRTRGQRTGGQRTGGQRTGGQRTRGQRTWGQRTWGQRTLGQRTGGQRTRGQRLWHKSEKMRSTDFHNSTDLNMAPPNIGNIIISLFEYFLICGPQLLH